jgi:hypothetical protein
MIKVLGNYCGYILDTLMNYAQFIGGFKNANSIIEKYIYFSFIYIV